MYKSQKGKLSHTYEKKHNFQWLKQHDHGKSPFQVTISPSPTMDASAPVEGQENAQVQGRDEPVASVAQWGLGSVMEFTMEMVITPRNHPSLRRMCYTLW